jgi:hypothetical protein
MDPYKATVSFLTGFRFADGRTAAGLNKIDWENLPIHVACQKVQGSEFGDGSNYQRNIPYAQMVIDSDKGDNCMAQYGDFDGALDGATVPYGIDDYHDPNARRNSLRESLWATNRAAYSALDLIRSVSADIQGTISNAATVIVNRTPGNVVTELFSRRFPWWNQDDVPVEQQGTNNIIENLFATNGRVYHPLWGNKALSDKLDLVAQLIQVMQPNNTEIARLVKEYNDTHVAKVPVVEKLPVTKPVDGTNPPSPKDF